MLLEVRRLLQILEDTTGEVYMYSERHIDSKCKSFPTDDARQALRVLFPSGLLLVVFAGEEMPGG